MFCGSGGGVAKSKLIYKRNHEEAIRFLPGARRRLGCTLPLSAVARSTQSASMYFTSDSFCLCLTAEDQTDNRRTYTKTTLLMQLQRYINIASLTPKHAKKNQPLRQEDKKMDKPVIETGTSSMLKTRYTTKPFALIG